MTVTGIIAEFNPFHNGHAYLLEQVQGTKIIAMSGNFTQRGEPAIVDKWTRTKMALENGADLVVELPFLVSVQAADFFAQGAVDILWHLGIERLAFGTEEVLDYQEILHLYKEKEAEMKAYIAHLPDSLSYAQKTQHMWETFAGLSFSGATPNHILALAYIKALAGKKITPHPVKRKGAGFHSLSDELEYASATAIRLRRQDSAFLARYTPAHHLLLSSPQLTWEAFFDYLRYKIVSEPDLTAVYQVNEELAIRLKEAIKTATSIEELIRQVATKRYTKARIRRILTYILVNAREHPLPKEIHVLGFTEKGRQHLAKVKGRCSLVSRIGKEPWDSLTQQADRIYQLGHANLLEQTWGRSPVRLEK